MAIEKIESYSAECDNCKEDWEHHFEGWTIMVDEDSLKECMADQDWYEGDGVNGEKGKWYCDKCYHLDEDDKFILNTERTKI